MKKYIFFSILFFALATQSQASESVSRLYIPSSAQTTILKENGEQKILVKDYLNSTRALEGTTQESQRYFPYGDDSETESLKGTDRQFTGHRKLEETGVYHAGARFYSPQLGQFIQADKVEGPNRYAYVQGNPIKYIDSSGNSCETSPLNFPDIGCNDYRVPEAIKEDLAPEYWNRLRDATMIVRMWENSQDGESGEEKYTYKGYGSGVSIGSGQVLTNRHIAKSYDTYTHNIGHPLAKIGSEGKSFIHAKPEWISEKYDMALMNFDAQKVGGGFGTVPLANSRPKVGDPIFGLGYAGYTLNRKGASEIKPIRGRVLGYDDAGNMMYGFGSYIDDGREDIPFSFGGRSGSGLVNEQGELVGIHYASWGTFKSYVGNPDDVPGVMVTIKNMAKQYGFNPSYIEGIGYAVPINNYLERK